MRLKVEQTNTQLLIEREKFNQREAELNFKLEEQQAVIEKDMMGRIEELEADLKMKSAYCGELQAQISD